MISGWARPRALALTLLLLAVAAAIGAAGTVWLVQHGFSARDEPSAVEAFIARRLRLLAIPRSARAMQNPITSVSSELLADARAHFADHCAICHANDGSGETEIGRNLYPKAPDMRKSGTQSLSDGELFLIIHNGIRFTGMPAWGGQSPEEDRKSWELVHFIRHLPRLTDAEIAEMKKMNPKSQREIEENKDIDQFLRGGETPPPHHH